MLCIGDDAAVKHVQNELCDGPASVLCRRPLAKGLYHWFIERNSSACDALKVGFVLTFHMDLIHLS